MEILILIYCVTVVALVVVSNEYSVLYFHEPYDWKNHPEVIAITIIPVVNIVWLLMLIKDIAWINQSEDTSGHT